MQQQGEVRSAPAEPIVTPIGVMSCIDVWTSVTIGQSTTTAISAMAGPSQGSGASRRRARGPARPPEPARAGAGRRSRAAVPRRPGGDVRHRRQPLLVAVCWIALSTCPAGCR